MSIKKTILSPLLGVLILCSLIPRPGHSEPLDPDEPLAPQKGAASELDDRIHNLEQRLGDLQNLAAGLAAELGELRGARETPSAVGQTATANRVDETAAPQATASSTHSHAPGNVVSNAVESVLPGLKLSGTVMLFDYSPLRVDGAQPKFDLYGAWFNFDRQGEKLGFHMELRERTTKFRSFFEGTSWIQEVYVKGNVPGGMIKAGRFYKQQGIFSDYSFYGDLLYFDGIKYNAEWGMSYEGDNKINNRLSFQHDLQFFRTDGRTNGSYPGRDVVSDPNSQRRNEVLVRGVPKIQLSEKASVAFGSTFERGTVTRLTPASDNTYRRVAGEVTLRVGPATIFAEVLRQSFDGPAFGNLPKVTYALAGGNYDITKKVSLHFNYSQGNYSSVDPTRRKEYIVQPGLIVQLGKGFSFYEEYNYWIRKGVTKAVYDRSMNSVLVFSF